MTKLKLWFTDLLIQVLDVYFQDRRVEFYPTAGRPMLQGIARGARRNKTVIQVRVDLPTEESRWVNIRRGRRDDKSGVWCFWEE